MPPSADKQFEILSDHYKDTFSHQREHLKQRDRLFLFILLLGGVMLFQVFSPEEYGQAVSTLIAKKLDVSSSIDIAFLGSVLWFMFFGLIVRYFQVVLHTERQYGYIHDLEKELHSESSGVAFTREGEAYLKDYTLFAKWMDSVYKIVFPGVLLMVVILKTSNEIDRADRLSGAIAFNVFVSLCILTSIVLYFIALHWKK